MPLNRYQIRNEYSLADPDLYRAADKDDPEALLEGIAMAGLVGVLRQLGDLAEFAAEIFHDLHEQVMATASRGHSLMVRVQQLEAEFPMIEKTFLSQTNHSSFYYNAGTDWHPNLRMDQNLITQGDLPRFVMDSYEECRGPPRLFLLDKFDVAGAGACLKRYTDPSFFKVETSHSDVVRDKKTRKAKRKGSRWRNGATPEILSTSHAKLHQLFLEERTENGTLYSAGRVKLKRRLNGFPFDTKSGKSYMEKFLKPPSPDHDEVHVIPEDLSPLALPYNSTDESTFDVVEISVVSPEKKSKQRMRSSHFSPAREETALELAAGELNEVSSAEGSLEGSEPKLGFQAYEISSTSHVVPGEKEITVDGGLNTKNNIDDNQSDDAASEIDNYVDALTTMDSEIDTDSELRSKNDFQFSNRRGQSSNVDANGRQLQAHSADSLSTGNSTLSDDGSSLSKKDLSSFSYSDTHSGSAENIPLDTEVSSNILTSYEIHEADPSPIQQSVDEERELPRPLEDIAFDGPFVEAIEIPSHCRELDGPNESSIPKDSVIVHKSAEAIVNDTISEGVEIDDLVNCNMDPPPLPIAADACEQEEEYLPQKMPGEILADLESVDSSKIDNNIGCTSCLHLPSISGYDLSLQVPSEKQFVNEFDDVAVNQDENAVASSADLIVPCIADENLSLIHTGLQPLDESIHEEKLLSSANHSDGLILNRDEVSPTSSSGNPLLSGFGVEGPDCNLDVSVDEPNIVKAATEKEITENVLPMLDREDNSVKKIVGLQNSGLPLPEDKPSDPMNEELETDYSFKEPDERVSEVDSCIPSTRERVENVIFKVDNPITRESVESCNPEMKADVRPLEQEQTLYLGEECSQHLTNAGSGAIIDEAASDSDLIESDTTTGASLLAEVQGYLNEVGYEPVTAATTVTGQGNEDTNALDGFSFVGLKTLQERSLSSFREEYSGMEIDTYILSKPAESDVLQQKFTSPGSDNLHNGLTDDNIGAQICNDDTYVSGIMSGLNIDEALATQSFEQQYEQEPHHLEEDIGLQLKQLGSDLHHLGTFDTSSESLPSQSSPPEQLRGKDKIDITEHHLPPSNPMSSSFHPLPNSGRIYFEEMPPLPPLPPVQWRMGKLQNASPARESVIESNHNATAFPSPLSASVNQEAQALNPFMLQPTLSDEKSAPLSEHPLCSSGSFLSEISPVACHGDLQDEPPLERIQAAGSLLQSPAMHGVMVQTDSKGGEGGKVKPSLDSYHEAFVTDAADLFSLSHEGHAKPLDQMTPEISMSDLERQQSAHLEENLATSDAAGASITIANKDVLPTLEENLSQPSAEDGLLNGSQTMKLPRPRNPLIDAVVAHDKSKLRKVPERVKPQIQKADERDSLLEQIRTQSFNLKPAVVTRPSIQGPRTNLKVAAILEKAKTIRQAFAGSDEDDSWSDS